MKTKPFFRRNTPAEIRDLQTKVLYSKRDLVERIVELDPTREALLLRFIITSGKHQKRGRTHREASVKALRHGPYLRLDIPGTLRETIEQRVSPLKARDIGFEELRRGNLSEAAYVGYEFRPVQGNDRVPRRIPFARVVDSARLFAYALTQTRDHIPVRAYDGSDRVASEGAVAVASVPSKTSGEKRYTVLIRPFPTHDNKFQEAIAWGFRTEGRDIPLGKLYSFGFEFDPSRADSERIILDDKDGAAMLAVAQSYMQKEHNPVPWENNVFAKPSQRDATFNGRVENNVLIYDPTLKKPGYRPLHLAERSIVLGMLLASLEPRESMFWQAGRDPKFTEYVWNES